MPKPSDDEPVGPPLEPAEVLDPTQVDEVEKLSAIERVQIDQQVATAKRYPRSIKAFLEELKSYAGASPEIAEKMSYSLPRGKDEKTGRAKFVEGPSVRLAEAAVAAWGNTRSGARTLGADATHVYCQGFAHDLQKNNYVAFEIKRRITGKYGRFNEDMITVTGAAGAKIAWRNAIFGVIPKAHIMDAALYAKKVAAGAVKSVDASRKECMDWWAGLGGKPAQLFELLGVASEKDMEIGDLLRAKGLKTAIEDGEATFADLVAGLDETTVARPAGLSPDELRAGKTKTTDNADQKQDAKAAKGAKATAAKKGAKEAPAPAAVPPAEKEGGEPEAGEDDGVNSLFRD